MEITEVRIKLMEEAGDRLQAFCSITFDDCFVVRDLKIIEGAHGPFVAMPSRKLTSRCPQCGCKNHLRAPHCNQCGLKLRTDRALKDENGRAKLYADIAHPINSACREMIQERIIQAFREEHERAKQPGYISAYDEYDLENEFAQAASNEEALVPPPAKPDQTAPQKSHPQVTQTKVEPAEAPRGPHKVPSHTTAHRHDSGKDPESFGAGVF